jgi:hypothetical protein
MGSVQQKFWMQKKHILIFETNLFNKANTQFLPKNLILWSLP